MTKTILLATTMMATTMLLTGGTASAQSATAIETPPQAAASQQGVLVFQPDFFASSSPNTALDMINRLPGFGLDTGNNGTRGFAGAAGNVLIDGDRPSSKSDSLDAVLQRISATNVERIELIRGGAPGIDMQGRAVVANVVLKQAVEVQRVIEVNAYLYPDGYVGPLLKAEYSRREGDNQIEGALSATTDRTDGTGDGYRRRYDPSGVLIQDASLALYDRIRYVDARGAIQRRMFGGKMRVNGLLHYDKNIRQLTTTILTGAGSNEFSDQTFEGLNGELGINWSRPLSERLELELTGLQRWSDGSSLAAFTSAGGASVFGDDTVVGESIARGVVRFRRNERWSYEGGGEVAYNVLDSETSYSENGVAIPLPSDTIKVEELRGEVFGQATWQATPKLTVEAGLRVEVSEISQSGDSDQSKQFVYPKPRLQLTWTPATGHQFRARFEREVGQLDFGDFVASADVDLGQVEGGNPDLEPDKSTLIELVYERRFWSEGALTLTAQYVEIEDLIDVIPLAGGFEAVGNIGDASAQSFQAALTLPMDRLGLSNARLRVRASWADSEVIDPLTGTPRRFSGQQAFGCGVNFNQDLRGGRWSYGFDHGCNVDEANLYRIREVRRYESEPFVTGYGQWKPSRDLTVRVDLGNVTDRQNRNYRIIHDGPRDTAPLLRREERGTRMSPWIFLQIRKTL